MPPLPRGERDLTCSLLASRHYIQGQECSQHEPWLPHLGVVTSRPWPSSPTLWLWGTLGRCCCISEPCFPHLYIGAACSTCLLGLLYGQNAGVCSCRGTGD